MGILPAHWLETTLEAWVEIEDGNARISAVRAMARELRVSCRSNRQRVVAAREFLDKHREVLNHDDLQEVLLLMLKLLKEHDPIILLGSRSEGS